MKTGIFLSRIERNDFTLSLALTLEEHWNTSLSGPCQFFDQADYYHPYYLGDFQNITSCDAFVFIAEQNTDAFDLLLNNNQQFFEGKPIGLIKSVSKKADSNIIAYEKLFQGSLSQYAPSIKLYASNAFISQHLDITQMDVKEKILKYASVFSKYASAVLHQDNRQKHKTSTLTEPSF